MAGTFKFSEQELDESLGLLMKACNADIIDRVVPLAQALGGEGDSNELINNLLDDGKAFQATANTYRNWVDEVIKSFEAVADISAWVKKQQGGGQATAQDLSGGVKAIDSSSVIQ